jgi:hypothetical protein
MARSISSVDIPLASRSGLQPGMGVRYGGQHLEYQQGKHAGRAGRPGSGSLTVTSTSPVDATSITRTTTRFMTTTSPPTPGRRVPAFRRAPTCLARPSLEVSSG